MSLTSNHHCPWELLENEVDDVSDESQKKEIQGIDPPTNPVSTTWIHLFTHNLSVKGCTGTQRAASEGEGWERERRTWEEI